VFLGVRVALRQQLRERAHLTAEERLLGLLNSLEVLPRLPRGRIDAAEVVVNRAVNSLRGERLEFHISIETEPLHRVDQAEISLLDKVFEIDVPRSYP
jgi:hypothetical protein